MVAIKSKSKTWARGRVLFCPAERGGNSSDQWVLCGERVVFFDRLANEHAAAFGRRAAVALDFLGSGGQALVLDVLSKPPRVVAAAQVKQPRRLVDAFRHLHEESEILST